ncbi:MAG: ABC transporter permease [Xanthomonadales bacterium]|nr:ABC transporter permease [Xanthomonadales bacterium]
MLDDLRFALRSLLRTPGSVLAITLILGLGIGVNTAVFSLYDGVVLRDLPYQNADRLVLLQQHMAEDRTQTVGFSPLERADYQSVTALDRVEEFHTMSFTLLGLNEPLRVQTGVVSASFFATLGVNPILGRDFAEGEDDYAAAPLMLLSNEFWREHAGADPNIVGTTLTMNDRAHQIIGVLPPITQLPNANDVYITLAHCPARSNPNNYDNRSFRLVQAIGRTAPGADLERVNLELATVASRLKTSYPDQYPGDQRYEVDATPFKDVYAANFVDTGTLLLWVAGLILLAALANVSNLALVRLSRRSGELGVRASFGATRARIMRLLLVEHLALGLIGGLLGIVFAILSVHLLRDYALRFTPLANDVSLDLRVLAFGVTLSLLVGLITGLLPAINARLFERPLVNLSTRTASDAGGMKKIRGGLIVAQLAVTLIVATAASMLLKSLAALDRVDPGFPIERVVSARVELNTANYRDFVKRTQFVEQLQQRLAADPSVRASGVSLTVPMQSSGAFMETAISLPDRPDLDTSRLASPDYRVAGESYFETLGIALLSGRMFSADDNGETYPVVLINQSLARLYWPDGDPVGKRLTPQMNMTTFSDQPDFEVIGVVADVMQYGLREAEGPAFYVPYRQGPFRQLRVSVRAADNEGRIKTLIRNSVRAIDPDIPLDQLMTLVEVRDQTLASTRLMASLIGAFAALVGLISAIGLGGLIAYDIDQRAREFCIRLALGAKPGSLVRLMLGNGLKLTGLGLLIGVFGAAMIGRGLEEFLYATGAIDLLSIIAAALGLMLIAVIATLIPARRLTRVDPAAALAEQ